MTKPRAFLAFPGGASHCATLAGAAARAVDDVEVAGVSGVSAGFLVAVLVAFGKLGEAPALLRRLLASNRILDFNGLDGNLGLTSWNVVAGVVDDVLGRGVKMGDSPIPLVGVATNADTGEPFYFSKRDTPEVLVSEVARVSTAILPLARMHPVPSLGTSLSPDRRWFFDGGFVDNLPDHVFDHHVEPTVSFSLRPVVALTGEPFRVREADPVNQALAVLQAVTFAQGQRKTKRSDGHHVVVDAVGSGLDFDLTGAEVDTRLSRGAACVSGALPSILAALRQRETEHGHTP